MLTRALLRADVRDRIFRLADKPAPPLPPARTRPGSLDDPGHGSPDEEPFPRLDPPPPPPRRIGMEAELIPVDAEGRACPVTGPGPATLPWVRRHAATLGWEEDATAAVPRFLLPDGSVLFFEPGGQLEYSTVPHLGPSALLARLREVVKGLEESAHAAGVSLLGVGMDPRTPLAQVPLQLESERYLRMDRYLSTLGAAGRRMMRQTASCQVNLDFPPEPLAGWRLANAAAPYLLAMFANSPLYEGRPTGYRSTRARVWRELDPTRTGLLRAPLRGEAAVDEYLEFALGARWFLGESGVGDYPPFRLVLEELTDADWRAHLTTLFPEVRPRGYLEIRSLDALPPAWYAAPLVLLTGLLHHPPSLEEAVQRLGEPDPALLERAGAAGLRDPELAVGAGALVRLGLEGAAAIGTPELAPGDLAEAADFFERFTLRGRSPADDVTSRARVA